jgi:glycosyltransferase involved in cell wall biosynthesis
MREVASLRAAGFDVHTFTVRASGPEQLLSERDRIEHDRTFAILPTTPMAVLRAHVSVLWGAPRRYFEALWTALRCRPPGLRSAIWQLMYFGEAAILAAELQRRNIRHVCAHFSDVGASVTWLASLMCGSTWSLRLHGLADFGDPTAANLADKIQAADLVLCVSYFGRAQAMLKAPPDTWNKLHVVRCGLDTARFAPVEGAHRSGGRCEILCVGRLTPEKGHALLLEALEILLREQVDFHCTLVGGGPEHDRLIETARSRGLIERVHFAGSVGQDDIQEYFDRADVFVLPSFAEGLPVVLMEAMAKSLAVVSTHVMGIPELVEHGVNGILVPPGCPESLADALAALAADPDRRSSMGERGREKIVREFDFVRTGQQLAAILSALDFDPVHTEAGQRGP